MQRHYCFQNISTEYTGGVVACHHRIHRRVFVSTDWIHREDDSNYIENKINKQASWSVRKRVDYTQNELTRAQTRCRQFKTLLNIVASSFGTVVDVGSHSFVCRHSALLFWWRRPTVPWLQSICSTNCLLKSGLKCLPELLLCYQNWCHINELFKPEIDVIHLL